MTRRIIGLFVLAAAVFTPRLTAADGPWAAVDTALGREGKDLPGDVRKYGFPRSDLTVTAGGVTIEPALALGSWAAFRKHPKGTGVMAMGDLVLLPSELAAALRALSRGGLAVTAVHNHLVGEQPEVVYVHFEGSGEAAALAQGLRSTLQQTKAPLDPPGPPPLLTPQEKAAFEDVQAALGRKGALAGRVLQVGVPRKGRIEENGMEIPPAMGMAIALNFQASGDRVATTGDFVLTADEVDPVMRTLESYGVEVTALHSHMLRESPRLFFMHFWGVGSPESMGGALKAALLKVAVAP